MTPVGLDRRGALAAAAGVDVHSAPAVDYTVADDVLVDLNAAAAAQGLTRPRTARRMSAPSPRPRTARRMRCAATATWGYRTATAT